MAKDNTDKTDNSDGLSDSEKIDKALALNKAMVEAENQVAVRPPALINRGGQAYQGSPVVPPPVAPGPATQGRMYMGPSMSPEQEAQFMQTRPGTRINLMPPPVASPENDARNRQMILDSQGPARGSAPIAMPAGMDPKAMQAQEQYEAQQRYQMAIDRGVDPKVALAQFGPGLVPPRNLSTTASPMTTYQQAQVDLAKQRLEAQSNKAVAPPKISEIDKDELGRMNKRDASIQNKLDALSVLPQLDDAQQETKRLLLRERVGIAQQRQAIGRKYQPGAVEPPSGAKNEVTKIAKNGKLAVFDATTRKFIRYE